MTLLQSFAAIVLALGSVLILRAVWLADSKPRVRAVKRRVRVSGEKELGRAA